MLLTFNILIYRSKVISQNTGIGHGYVRLLQLTGAETEMGQWVMGHG